MVLLLATCLINFLAYIRLTRDVGGNYSAIAINNIDEQRCRIAGTDYSLKDVVDAINYGVWALPEPFLRERISHHDVFSIINKSLVKDLWFQLYLVLYDEPIHHLPEWLQGIRKQVLYGILYDSCLLYRLDDHIGFRPYSHHISDVLNFLYYVRTEENYRSKIYEPYFTTLREFIAHRKRIWREEGNNFVGPIPGNPSPSEKFNII